MYTLWSSLPRWNDISALYYQVYAFPSENALMKQHISSNWQSLTDLIFPTFSVAVASSHYFLAFSLSLASGDFLFLASLSIPLTILPQSTFCGSFSHICYLNTNILWSSSVLLSLLCMIPPAGFHLLPVYCPPCICYCCQILFLLYHLLSWKDYLYFHQNNCPPCIWK